MAEIISINGAEVKIGLNDGSVTTVPIAVVAYANPKVGDEINVYKDGSETIIRKTASNATTEEKNAVIQINNSQAINGPVVATPTVPAKRIDKIVYILVVLFLGWLGVHYFMRGKIGLGILYLLTFGLFFVGQTVDFIIALVKLNDYEKDYLFTRYGDWLV